MHYFSLILPVLIKKKKNDQKLEGKEKASDLVICKLVYLFLNHTKHGHTVKSNVVEILSTEKLEQLCGLMSMDKVRAVCGLLETLASTRQFLEFGFKRVEDFPE